MKSLLFSMFWKTASLIIPLSLTIGSSTIAQAGDGKPLMPCSISPRGSDYLGGSPRGYLAVYLAADEFSNAWYLPHSFFAIYTVDGKLFKKVTSQYFADDEIPEVVALAAGSYMVVGRSEKDGYIRRPVVIKAGQRAVLDLDLRQAGTPGRIAQNGWKTHATLY